MGGEVTLLCYRSNSLPLNSLKAPVVELQWMVQQRKKYLVFTEKIKPGDDAGMPGIEENDPAKGEDTLTG